MYIEKKLKTEPMYYRQHLSLKMFIEVFKSFNIKNNFSDEGLEAVYEFIEDWESCKHEEETEIEYWFVKDICEEFKEYENSGKTLKMLGVGDGELLEDYFSTVLWTKDESRILVRE